jgi:hypothetical protein
MNTNIQALLKTSCSPFRVILVVAVLFSSSISANKSELIEPKHVMAKVLDLEQQIASLALIMGVDFKPFTPPTLNNIFPRDVFYQGITVHKKASRIRYEFTKQEIRELKIESHDYRSEHVLKLVTKTQSILDDTLRYIYQNHSISREDISKSVSQQTSAAAKVGLIVEPKDVFVRLVNINRKLNQLLDFKFSPADTFEQVTLAISYASAILQTVSQEVTLFEPERLESGKKPSDVYLRLTSVHNKLYECLESVNVLTTQISEKIYEPAQIQPSDVYDLTNLILSNLAFLQSNLTEQVKPRPTYYPGKTLPSVVYQRVSILEKQIDAIHQLRHKLKMR